MPNDPQGRTALHYAAMTDEIAQISVLLAQGIDPNAQDEQGLTALHFAAQEGALAAAELLLAGEALVDPVDVHGNTPLFTAVFNSRGRGELIHLLRNHGADPRHANNSGQTPLGLARLIGNYDVAQYFSDID